jgi:hypothetical protein
MDIKGFRLNGGEIIVGDLRDSYKDTYDIDNAVQLMMHDVGNGRMGIAMQPFIPFSKGIIQIKINTVSTLFDVDQNVINEYNRLFGSGIVIASQEIISQH